MTDLNFKRTAPLTLYESGEQYTGDFRLNKQIKAPKETPLMIWNDPRYYDDYVYF